MDVGRTSTTGTRLLAGRYRLLEPVGSGGMGVVWRARDERLDRLVAVKEVRPPAGMTGAEYADLRERTLREARAAARLSTPGAVAVHDVVESDGQPYVVMELLHGRSLAQVVAEDGPLPPAEVARIGLSLLTTLAAAHRAGILHRDVKPANVVLEEAAEGTGAGRVVLTDFGIAKTAGDPQLTSTGVLLGSPAYIAPERARGREAGPASDLYALGATLFTAVEGRPPFAGPDAMATLLAVAGGDRQPFVAAGPLTPALEALLDPDPAGRPSAAEAERLLRPALAEGPTVPGPAATPPPVPDGPPAEAAAGERTQVVEVPVPAPPPAARPEPAPGRLRSGAGWTSPPQTARRRSPLLAVLAVLALLVAGGVAVMASRGDDPTVAAGAGADAADTAATAPADPTESTADAGTTGTTGSGASAPPDTPGADTPVAGGTGGAGDTGDTGDTTEAGDTAEAAGPADAGTVPAGWVTYTDDDGWSLAHPPGWRAEERDVRGERVVQVTSPEGGERYIRVSDDGTAGGDPVERWREFAAEFAARNPSYEEVGIEAVEDYPYTPAADWEFTYSSGGTRLHVVDRMLFVDDRAYAVLVQGSDDHVVREVFEGVVGSFRPA